MPYMYAYMHIHNKLLDTFFNSFSDHHYSMCTLITLITFIIVVISSIIVYSPCHYAYC